jgi:hypothetical protein
MNQKDHTVTFTAMSKNLGDLGPIIQRLNEVLLEFHGQVDHLSISLGQYEDDEEMTRPSPRTQEEIYKHYNTLLDTMPHPDAMAATRRFFGLPDSYEIY